LGQVQGTVRVRIDSRTVVIGSAGVLLTTALGALAGATKGTLAGALAALVGLVASFVVAVLMERQARQATDAARKQELLEMFAPPRPLDGREDEE